MNTNNDNHTYMNEKETITLLVSERALFMQLMGCSVFAWEKNCRPQTFQDMMGNSSQQSATLQIQTLEQNVNLSTTSILEKNEPRIASWGVAKMLSTYSKNTSPEQLLEQLREQIVSLQEEKDRLGPNDTPSESLLQRENVVPILFYETKASLKRREQAQKELERLRELTLSEKIRQLKETPDKVYSDLFNRLVCQKLDELEKEGTEIRSNKSKLSFAEGLVIQALDEALTSEDIRQYLVCKLFVEKEKQLKRLLQKGIGRFGYTEQAVKFAALLYEIEEAKTDDVWQRNKFEEIVARALQGETLKLITTLCTINQFDYKGGYTLIPDLDAYQTNPKLEPVPLIVDELALVKKFFEFYGINTSLAIYVADTDYTEVGQYGPVKQEKLLCLSDYLANLKDYVKKFGNDITVTPISEVTDNNLLYKQVKQRILRAINALLQAQVTDFAREWGRKFENAFEKISESQGKKKLFAPSEIRRKALDIAKMIWSVNGAQGAVYGTLGQNTILVSTERRERDQNYILDKQTRANFPPVLYILKAAEMWNRKLTGKAD